MAGHAPERSHTPYEATHDLKTEAKRTIAAASRGKEWPHHKKQQNRSSSRKQRKQAECERILLLGRPICRQQEMKRKSRITVHIRTIVESKPESNAIGGFYLVKWFFIYGMMLKKPFDDSRQSSWALACQNLSNVTMFCKIWLRFFLGEGFSLATIRSS